MTTLQVPWVAAQALFILQQPLLIGAVLGFWIVGRRGPRPWLVSGAAMLGLSALLYLMSGVFGWHVAALSQLGGQDRSDAERLAAVVFELVEFGYFLPPGLALTASVGIACQAAWYVWLGRRLRRAALDQAST